MFSVEALHVAVQDAACDRDLQVIVMDELSTNADTKEARSISRRGISLVATAHAPDLQALMSNPELRPLLGNFESVTLGDDTAR